MKRILFVCLGNICRSPTAEAVFRARAEKVGMLDLFTIDSAGTGHWHIGKAPDARATAAAARRGYDMSSLRARQVCQQDFDCFDLLVAMDQSNADGLTVMQPKNSVTQIGLLLDFAEVDERDVPDPYYGGAAGFEQVIDLVEAGCDGLLDQLLSEHGPVRAE